MKRIDYCRIVDAVAGLCATAARELPPDVIAALERSLQTEESPCGRAVISELLENARIARMESIPICQDTGLAIIFVELGNQVEVCGGFLIDAINEGVRRGYREAFLRPSLVRDPLFHRSNTGDNTPAIIHVELVVGHNLTITLLPKGGGCENASAQAMLNPGEDPQRIVSFVADSVISSAANACPPLIVGVGIGGSYDVAALIAKKALLRPVGLQHPDDRYADLERQILERINRSGIGPQGLGGRITAMAVHIETFPCHIASLPVAVCVNCHASRKASITL